MKKTDNEIYVSVDIEADGPIPGPNSMLSLGAAAFTADGKMISTFSVNFDQLPDAKPNADTMKWWGTQPDAWEACRKNCLPPDVAITRFKKWVEGLSGKPVCIAYPAGYDFTWIYWYLINFTGSSPFSFSCIDIKTMAMTVLKTDYRSATKRNMPKHWFGKTKHNHIALDDAIGQGELFCNILGEMRENKDDTD